MLALTEPIGSGVARVLNTEASPSSSTASPRGVPEPWPSRYPASAGSAPARSQAARMVRLCAVALGELMVATAPPLCSTALPRRTAWTGAPSARAWATVVSSSTAPPSPGTAPSASAS